MSADARMRELARRCSMGGDAEAEAQLLAEHVRRGLVLRPSVREFVAPGRVNSAGLRWGWLMQPDYTKWWWNPPSAVTVWTALLAEEQRRARGEYCGAGVCRCGGCV